MGFHAIVINMARKLNLSGPIPYHVTQINPQCSQIHAILKTTYIVHTNGSSGVLYTCIEVVYHNGRPCRVINLLATTRWLHMVVAHMASPNLIIAPPHMVAMGENLGHIGWHPLQSRWQLMYKWLPTARFAIGLGHEL